jgi:hypothetical protein
MQRGRAMKMLLALLSVAEMIWRTLANGGCFAAARRVCRAAHRRQARASGQQLIARYG